MQGYTSAVRWFAAGYLLGQAGKISWEQVDSPALQQWIVQLLGRYRGAYAEHPVPGQDLTRPHLHRTRPKPFPAASGRDHCYHTGSTTTQCQIPARSAADSVRRKRQF